VGIACCATGARGVSLSTACNWAWNIVIAQFVPVMQETMSWNIFSLFGGCCLVMTLFAHYNLPETKGMSLEAIQQYFGNLKRVSGGFESRSLLK
jgi:cytochrome b subunit of formate dehydrogenase